MRPMKMSMDRGSHLPILMKLMEMTKGPVLELGSGMYSSTYLYWMCARTERKLVTYEHNPDYIHWILKTANDWHEVHQVTDWDAIDLSDNWSIAFIDHAPAHRRGIEALKLLHADYVVCHDSQNNEAKKYGIDKAYKQFKYRYKYTKYIPYTSLWSNKFDVRKFEVG